LSDPYPVSVKASGNSAPSTLLYGLKWYKELQHMEKKHFQKQLIISTSSVKSKYIYLVLLHSENLNIQYYNNLRMLKYFFQKHAQQTYLKRKLCRQLRAFIFKTIEIQGWKFRTIFASVCPSGRCGVHHSADIN
jgi:hypothetical protein